MRILHSGHLVFSLRAFLSDIIDSTLFEKFLSRRTPISEYLHVVFVTGVVWTSLNMGVSIHVSGIRFLMFSLIEYASTVYTS